MSKSCQLFEPHLAVREITVPSGGDWAPRAQGWSMVWIQSGAGYWLHPRANQPLEPGMALALGHGSGGGIRASQLGDLRLRGFEIRPERLAGLLTLEELGFFQAAAAGELSASRLFPAGSAVAGQMRGLCESQDARGSAFRLRLVQIFLGVFEEELKRTAAPAKGVPDARERLKDFLGRTPASELMNMSFGELERATGCTRRHLSRVFHEVVGTTFRDKQAELRLARACELLASTEFKVVDVALESGYQSLSLFNLMFKRHLGASPARWRLKHSQSRGASRPVLPPRVQRVRSDVLQVA